MEHFKKENLLKLIPGALVMLGILLLFLSAGLGESFYTIAREAYWSARYALHDGPFGFIRPSDTIGGIGLNNAFRNIFNHGELIILFVASLLIIIGGIAWQIFDLVKKKSATK